MRAVLSRSLPQERATRVGGSFALVLGLFFTWGLAAALNDLMVADLRGLFHLPYRVATLIQSTYFGTAFVCALPAARLVRRLTYHRAMVTGLAIMAAGASLYLPLTSVGEFVWLLVPILVLAAGSTLLQAAAGPYVALLGPEKGAPSRFSLALGVNSFGAALAPAVGGLFLLGRGHRTLAALRGPYVALTVGLLLLTAAVHVARFPEPDRREADLPEPLPLRELARQARLMGGVVAMTAYVGAEVAIGALLINFLELPQTAGDAPRHAAALAGLYGGGAMVGRLGGALVLDRLSPMRVLAGCAAAAVLLVGVAAVASGGVAAAALLLVGLCNAVMVPVIFTGTLAGLGARTDEGTGMLVAALLGGAVVPTGIGAAADHLGLQHAFLLVLPLYGIVLGYALLYGRLPAPFHGNADGGRL